jgi:hypothetical protein
MAGSRKFELCAYFARNYQPVEGKGSVSAAAPFMFAWSIVDSANRLHGLVKNFLNLADKNHASEYRAFGKLIEPIEDLRNAVQHMVLKVVGTPSVI